ncbi:MAG: hypothetical protein AB7E55_12120 [Pigmentiphaga sp.]
MIATLPPHTLVVTPPDGEQGASGDVHLLAVSISREWQWWRHEIPKPEAEGER